MSISLPEPGSIEAEKADQRAIRRVDHLLSHLAERKERPQLIGEDGDAAELPESLFALLRQITQILAQGDGVSISPVHKVLTTQQAADILNVSRPYLISLLEKGELEFSLTGKHRRIQLGNLLAYKRKRDRQRREQLAELTRLSEDFGSYE